MQPGFTELSVIDYFRSAGEQLAKETELLGGVITRIVSAQGQVTNKAIIIQLIAELEQTDDPQQMEVIRKTLEVVVGRTPDDVVI